MSKPRAARCAILLPIVPIPRMPRRLPEMVGVSTRHWSCHPPARTKRSACSMCRVAAINSIMAESATAGCVRVGAIGDRDAPAPGRVQIDRFIARADGADDLELRKQRHLVAAQAPAAVGQHGPDGIAGLAHGVSSGWLFLPLAHGVARSGQRGGAFRTESHHGQDTDAHKRSFETVARSALRSRS